MKETNRSEIKRIIKRISLVVQWLRLCDSNMEGPGSIPGQRTSSHRLQLKILCATTKDPVQSEK